MKMRLHVTGADEIRRALAALGPEAANSAKFVLHRVAQEAVPEVQAVTPVQPTHGGELRASVRATRPTYRRRDGVVTASVVAGGHLVDEKGFGRVASVYANVQEAGTWLTGRLAGIRIRHTVGKSPFMSQVVLRHAQTIPERLVGRIAAVHRLRALGIKA